MFEEYLPICFAVKECKKIQGRKKFQKIFYLAKRADMPIHETFKWNMFGPYSKELASEIDFLCGMELLSEEGSPGGEYSYMITKKGSAFLKKSLPPGEAAANDRFAKIFEILNTFNSQDLEKMASIKFLLEEGYEDTYIKTFLDHAKNYSSGDIEKGKKMLSELFEQFKKV